MSTRTEILRKLGVGRRQPNDPFFAAGDAVCRADKREGIIQIDDEDLCHEIVAKFPCNIVGCTQEFDSLLQYEMHYNSAHRYICSECRKQLPSPHLLDLHVSETHDSFFKAQAQRKPMYRCYVEDCTDVFVNAQDRRSHCIEHHKFPHDFRFDNARKNKCKSKKHSKGEAAMDVDEPSGDAKGCKPKAKSRGQPSDNPFSFGRGRGRQRRIACSTGSQNPNVWGTSDLMEALDTEPTN